MIDPKAVVVADVFQDRTHVGTLRRTQHGATFRYDDRYYDAHHAKPGGIAVHLPYAVREVTTHGVNLPPYFAGLLPEGLRLSALLKRLKTSEDDLFSLLLAAGPDTIGDLRVVPSGEPPEPGIEPSADVSEVGRVRFRALFEASLAAAGTRPETAIPGVQEKVSASMISFPVSRRVTRRAYLLKLNPPDKPDLVANEAFFMKMAGACGLEVAAVEVVHDADGETGLLVERFDRRWSKQEQRLVPLHQEDACQFLDHYPADKYRLSCAQIAEGLEICAAPIAERAKLLRLIAFSYLIGNGDLHAKNVSVLADGPGGGLRLSPAYDVLSTLPYGDRKMALKFDGKDDGLTRAMFVRFGERYGVKARATERLLDQLCDAAAPFAASFGEIGLTRKASADLGRVFATRSRALRGG